MLIVSTRRECFAIRARAVVGPMAATLAMGLSGVSSVWDSGDERRVKYLLMVGRARPAEDGAKNTMHTSKPIELQN